MTNVFNQHFDFIDCVLGVALVVLVVGVVLGKANMEEVLMFVAAIGLKKTPTTLIPPNNAPTTQDSNKDFTNY